MSTGANGAGSADYIGVGGTEPDVDHNNAPSMGSSGSATGAAAGPANAGNTNVKKLRPIPMSGPFQLNRSHRGAQSRTIAL